MQGREASKEGTAGKGRWRGKSGITIGRRRVGSTPQRKEGAEAKDDQGGAPSEVHAKVRSVQGACGGVYRCCCGTRLLFVARSLWIES